MSDLVSVGNESIENRGISLLLGGEGQGAAGWPNSIAIANHYR